MNRSRKELVGTLTLSAFGDVAGEVNSPAKRVGEENAGAAHEIQQKSTVHSVRRVRHLSEGCLS